MNIEQFIKDAVKQFISSHLDDIKIENFQGLMPDIWKLPYTVREALCFYFQRYKIDYIPLLLKDAPMQVEIPLSWLRRNPTIYDGKVLNLPRVGNNVLICEDNISSHCISTIVVGDLNARSAWLKYVDFNTLRIEHSGYDGVVIPWSEEIQKIFIPAGVKNVLVDSRMPKLKYTHAGTLGPIINAPKSCEPLKFLNVRKKEDLEAITGYY